MAIAEKPAKLNKIELIKAEKQGLEIKNQLSHFAQIGWENMDKSDLEIRLKWFGIFYRPVTPSKFMIRLDLKLVLKDLLISQLGATVK